MQDFNYLSSNDFEITLELGCDKYPKAERLALEWEKNKEALMHFMWQVIRLLKHGKSNNLDLKQVFTDLLSSIKGYSQCWASEDSYLDVVKGTSVCPSYQQKRLD